MNDLPRQKLVEIVAKHGKTVVDNPRRLEGLLRDYCGVYRREISVLTMALEERIAPDLLAAAKSTPRQVLLGRLAQRLCDNLALSEPAARWAVDSWAFALGIVSKDELKSFEQRYVVRTAATPTLIPTNIQTAGQNKTQKTGSINNFSVQKTIVVSAKGSGDFSTIAEAIRNASANAHLLIRPGIYNESIVIDKNLEIKGDGQPENVVIISAYSSCVQMQTDKATVRGLTLQGRGRQNGKAFFAIDVLRGELMLEDCDISSDSLSCVAIHGANANPFLENCRIHDGADSGIYIFDNARARIENCDVYQNANANIAITQGANPTIKNSRIYDGENGGIVVWGNGATATIEDCEITNHRLANIGISQSANPIFRRCKISGGRDSGVFVQQKGYGAFEECDVYGNAKAEVAVTDGSNTTLRRCTIHDGRESGVYVGNLARALVESCNIYDNADAGVYVYDESVVAVRRCNIHRNGKVAVRVKENSRASVEDCDLRGNRIATWETEHGVIVERKNNRE